MDSILLECSQNNSNNVLQNGVYETHLAQPIVLENGDKFALNRTFLDTQIENDGLINLQNDVTLEITCVPYIQNDDSDKFWPDMTVGGDGIDNSEYVLYEISKKIPDPTNPAEGLVLVESITFGFGGGDGIENYGDNTGVHPVTLSALDVNRKIFSFSVDVPFTSIDKKVTIPLDVVCLKTNNGRPGDENQDTTLMANNANGNWNFNRLDIKWGPAHYSPVNDPRKDYGSFSFVVKENDKFTTEELLITPRAFEQNDIVIPGGKYTPSEITEYINDRMNSNFLGGRVITAGYNLLSSPYLHLNQEFIFSLDYENWSFTRPGATQKPSCIFVASNPRFENTNPLGAILGMEGVSEKNYFIGTNRTELAYSDTDNKFYWNFLHFPIYSTSGAVVTQLTKTGGTTIDNSTYIQQSKNGGIIFTHLAATIKNPISGEQDPFDFWEAKLGFNLKELMPKPQSVTRFTAGGANQYSGNIYKITDGINTTNAANLITDLVSFTPPADPSDPTALHPYQKFQILDTGDIENFQTTSTFNNVIYAPNSVVGSGILDTAYYLVEIQLNFASNIIGETSITRNIVGIINRYYSRGAYVSSSGDSSFVLSHSGEPVVISSIKIRILNPDRTIAQLGSDNTLVFQVLKLSKDEML